MTALLTRRGSTVDAIDLFSGFGGSSQGIKAAGAKLTLAANHDPHKIEVHSLNNPDVDHVRADLCDPDAADYVDPEDLPPCRFLWCSPSCRHHSRANAQKLYDQGPGAELDDAEEDRYLNSEASRVTMMCPLRYARKHRPEIVVVENVVEVCNWGPKRDGSQFRDWMKEWDKLGYDVECCFFNSMFFPPCPQSRDRIYIVCWRKGNTKPDLDYRPRAFCTSDRCSGRHVDAVQTWKRRTASWPMERWGKYKAQYTYNCPDCGEIVEPVAFPAYTAIDWTNLGPTIEERLLAGKKLADKTLERIRRGLAKYGNGPGFIMPTKSTWGTDRTVTLPTTTQTTQQDKALATRGIFLPVAGNTSERPNQVRSKPLSEPTFTQHTTMAFGFAHAPFLTEMRGGGSVRYGQHAVSDPAHAVTAGGNHHGLVTPPLAAFAKFNGGPADTMWHGTQDPFNTITSRDATGLMIMPWVDQFNSDAVGLLDPLATIMTHARTAYAAAPEMAVTEDDIMGVHFRMLDPDPELRRVSAFAEDFITTGTKAQKVKGYGDAVTPPVSSWITGQCLVTLGAELPQAA